MSFFEIAMLLMTFCMLLIISQIFQIVYTIFNKVITQNVKLLFNIRDILNSIRIQDSTSYHLQHIKYKDEIKNRKIIEENIHENVG